MEVIRGIIAIAFLFSFAIFIHELGHFLFAKLFRVHVETFSIGFGRKLWRRKWGATEYCISLIPFGGYVKLTGMHSKEVEAMLVEEPAAKDESGQPEERPRETLSESVVEEMDALRAKPYWQKVLIFGAGCLNNLLTAVAVYFFMAWIGHYGPEPIPPVIESIDPSVEARVEIRAGDRIVAVSDEPVDKYTDFITGFEKYARAYKANAVPLTVVRDGTTQSLLLSAWLIPGFSPDEDRLVAVGDRGVTSVKRAGEAAAKLFGKAGEVAVTIERDGKKRVEQVPPAAAAGYQWPLLALEAERVPFIAMPIPNLPAERAGIRGGDMIIAIDGKPVRTCVQAIDFIRASIGKEIEIQVRREVAGGKIETLAFRLTVRPDPENESRGQIGVSFSQPITHKYQRPAGEAFVQAVESTFAISFAYLNAVRDLLSSSFQTIRENIGGPIAIGRHTYDVAQRGATWFFDFFAMFNIILAVTNLLPLPIFDGGHILFATIEAIIRRPLPAKILVRIYNVFIVLIIGLAVVISFNDVIMNFWRVF